MRLTAKKRNGYDKKRRKKNSLRKNSTGRTYKMKDMRHKSEEVKTDEIKIRKPNIEGATTEIKSVIPTLPNIPTVPVVPTSPGNAKLFQTLKQSKSKRHRTFAARRLVSIAGIKATPKISTVTVYDIKDGNKQICEHNIELIKEKKLICRKNSMRKMEEEGNS